MWSTTEYYKTLYTMGLGKDYEKEAVRLAELIRGHCPHARNVLDVACGNGEHARLLSRHFKVDGMDLQPEFVDLARKTAAGGRFEVADMTDFDLGRQYDVVMCLGSSFAAVGTVENLGIAMKSFRRHLAEKGLVIVERWFAPSQWTPGRVSAVKVETEDVHICRMSHSDQVGTLSVLTFEYLIGTKAGIVRQTERHELGLFTDEQVKDACLAAGITVEAVADPVFRRGLYVGGPYGR